MEDIELNQVIDFVKNKVEVSIQDTVGEETRAPFVSKTVTKVEHCPDKTHLRIYFDQKNFFAVPLTSEVTISDNEWLAFDKQSELYYVIRKVD